MHDSRGQQQHTHLLCLFVSPPRYGELRATSGNVGLKFDKEEGTVALEGRALLPTVTLEGVLLTRGKWYYEVTINQGGVCQIGWSDLEFAASSNQDTGVGDDKHSWSNAARFNASREWGGVMPAGTVIGVAADLDERSLSWSCNGDWDIDGPMGEKLFGNLFRNIAFVGGLTPAFSLERMEENLSCKFNIGKDPFLHSAPPGFEPVSAWVEAHRPGGGGGTTDKDKTTKEQIEAIPDAPPPPTLQYHPTMTGVKALGIRATSGARHVLLGSRNVGGDGGSGGNQDAALTLSASALYPSVVAQEVQLSEGKWFWEATVTKVPKDGSQTMTMAALGFASREFFGDFNHLRGVGDDDHSWGFHYSQNGAGSCFVARHGGKSLGGGAKSQDSLSVPDVIGCAADMDEGTLTWYLNGVETAQATIPRRPCKTSGKGELVVAAVAPAISLGEGIEWSVNFGQEPFVKCPPGFSSVQHWLRGEQRRRGLPVSEYDKSRIDKYGGGGGRGESKADGHAAAGMGGGEGGGIGDIDEGLFAMMDYVGRAASRYGEWGEYLWVWGGCGGVLLCMRLFRCSDVVWQPPFSTTKAHHLLVRCIKVRRDRIIVLIVGADVV